MDIECLPYLYCGFVLGFAIKLLQDVLQSLDVLGCQCCGSSCHCLVVRCFMRWMSRG